MSQVREILRQAAERKRRNVLADFIFRLVREKRLGVVGGVIVLILVFTGIFADVLAPYGMNEVNILNKMAAPSTEYLLGADQLGRDILTRLIYGARVSMFVGFTATAIAVLVAAIIGVPSGYFGGKYDIIVQRFVDAWISFPSLLLLLTLLSMVGQGMSQIISVLGILGGIGASRMVRSGVIGIRENDYFLAAKAIGSSDAGTVIRHIMPNIMPIMVIIFSVSVGGVILSEASLSFLGFGLPPEVPSWGGMLSGEARLYMEIKPSLALLPGLALATVVYGTNMFGDAMRDLLDPRLRGANRRACPVPRYGGPFTNGPPVASAFKPARPSLRRGKSLP